MKVNLQQSLVPVWKASQYCVYYVLYYKFDFTKRKLLNFNKFLDRVDEYRMLKDGYADVLYRNGIDLTDIVQHKIPLRTKLLMYNRPVKTKATEYNAIEESIARMFMMVSYALHKHYRFSYAKISEVLQSAVELSKLYSKSRKNPLTNAHMASYFYTEVGIPLYDVDSKGNVTFERRKNDNE